MVKRVRWEIGIIAERARGKAFGWVWSFRECDAESDAQGATGVDVLADLIPQSGVE